MDELDVRKEVPWVVTVHAYPDGPAGEPQVELWIAQATDMLAAYTETLLVIPAGSCIVDVERAIPSSRKPAHA